MFGLLIFVAAATGYQLGNRPVAVVSSVRDEGRKTVELGVKVATVASLLAPALLTSTPAQAAFPDFTEVRQDLEGVFVDRLAKAPTMLRLAWHSSGTYDRLKKDGGSGKGTIRFKEE
jgi:hypothetical protein